MSDAFDPEADQPKAQMSVADAFAEYTTSETLGANKPITLSATAAIYIDQGTIDVFVQEASPTHLGRRHHVIAVESGTLIWSGHSLSLPAGWRLIAVGHPQTAASTMTADRVCELVEPALLADAIESYVDGIVNIASMSDPSRPVAPTDADPTARIEAAAGLFDAALNAVVVAVRADARRAAADVAHTPAVTERRLERSLSDLAGIVDRTADLPSASHDEIAQLAIALARLGADLGVEFPTRPPEGASTEDALHLIVARAGCRARVVSLEGTWWKRPGIATLAFFGDDGRPVALLAGRRRFKLFDPATETTRPVDAATAARLASTGYAIYPPLPDGDLSAFGLARFGFCHTAADRRLLVAMGTLAGLVTLIVPIGVGIVYGSVLTSNHGSLLAAVIALLAGAAVTWAVVSSSRNLILVRLEGIFSSRIEPALIDRLLRSDSEFFRSHAGGDLAARVVGMQTIRKQISGSVITTFLTLVFSTFNLILIFFYSIMLGFIALATLVVVIVILVAINSVWLRYERRRYAAVGDLSALLYEGVKGIQKIRVAGAETRLMARWAEGFRAQMRNQYAGGRLSAWTVAITSALSAVVMVPLYGVAATLLRDRLTAGSFLAVLTALGVFTAAVAAMSLSLSSALTVVPLWERLRPILDARIDPVGGQSPGLLAGRIQLVDVDFRYRDDEDLVLEGVSIEAKPGEFIAITGTSGSGKSTLVRLLLGLDTPDRGTVLYDDRDLQLLDVRDVRRQIGAVIQNARPLPGEIKSAILGDRSDDDDLAWAAAEAAGLADDIDKMPMKLHTIVGEGGLAFSGGQIQRLMIAKALARKPPIIIFDEATSALDDKTQARVSEALEQIDSTRIVIAHRLSTIRHADRIYVIDAGKIVQVGSFDELIVDDGPFRKLAARQLV